MSGNIFKRIFLCEQRLLKDGVLSRNPQTKSSSPAKYCCLPSALRDSLVTVYSSLALGGEAHFGFVTGFYDVGLGDEIIENSL